MKITKDTPMNEVLMSVPKAHEILSEYGMGCVGCPFAMQESLADGAKVHGIDIKKLVKEINDTMEKSK
ncbi:DUF1858 domain-containing protein [Nanoarchaeota archaeon]